MGEPPRRVVGVLLQLMYAFDYYEEMLLWKKIKDL